MSASCRKPILNVIIVIVIVVCCFTSQQEPQEYPTRRTYKTLKGQFQEEPHLFPQLHTCDANPPWENKS